MKIERKVKNVQRGKKQRKNRLTKRSKRKQSFKSYSQLDEHDSDEYIAKNNMFDDTEKTDYDSLIKTIANIKISKLLSIKVLVAASLAVFVIVVSINISPILKYALQDETSAIYPILKKYADELRGISNKLTVVTRRLNMLSLVSEENELVNTTRINSLVLQINEMWFTTKKYLNFIGIETIARTDLEKEIEANSKINDKGLIRETKKEEIFPKEELSLTNVLKLDSIVQNLNTQINNINNEITFLEDNVYASIKASHIYSHLLERSRNANGNYYANSSPPQTSVKIEITKSKPAPIAAIPVSAPQSNELVKIKIKAPKKQNFALVKPVAVATTTPATHKKSPKKVAKQKQPKTNKKKTKKVVVAKVRVREPIKKIVGAFTIKDTEINTKLKSKKMTLNNANEKGGNSEPTDKSSEEAAYENTFLLDDTIFGFVTTYDDYGNNIEEEREKVNGVVPPEEEDDYTGG